MLNKENVSFVEVGSEIPLIPSTNEILNGIFNFLEVK